MHYIGVAVDLGHLHVKLLMRTGPYVAWAWEEDLLPRDIMLHAYTWGMKYHAAESGVRLACAAIS